jgi:threonine/homoserine/homoserine lactone efflux protein
MMRKIKPYHVNGFTALAQLPPAIMYIVLANWLLAGVWIVIFLTWAGATYISWLAYRR